MDAEQGQLRQADGTAKYMHMGFVEARKHRAAAGVDAPGIGTGQRQDLSLAAHRHEAIAGHRQRLRPWTGRVHGQDTGVMDDEIDAVRHGGPCGGDASHRQGAGGSSDSWTAARVHNSRMSLRGSTLRVAAQPACSYARLRAVFASAPPFALSRKASSRLTTLPWRFFGNGLILRPSILACTSSASAAS